MGSGLLVAFAAFGFAAWFSGAVSWLAFYFGARGPTLTGVAQAATYVGFVAGVIAMLRWYKRQCRLATGEVPARFLLAACLALPMGSIFWAIFVDAIAYHYGEDIVRPAFDFAIMYVVLGGVVPLTFGTPLLVTRWRQQRSLTSSAIAVEQ